MKRDAECYALLRQMRLFDDLMMCACFSDKETVQYVLRIILKRNIIVQKVTVQKDSEPSEYHGVRFDVLAIDTDGRQCDVEIQQQDDGDLVKRAGFYSCVLGRSALEKGKDYGDFRETYVIFITAKDVFSRGCPLYHIDRYIMETKEAFGDGCHIVFVNGAYTGDDDIGHLVHDMWQVDPAKMQSAVLSNRMKAFKGVDKEGKPMSELSKKLIDILSEEVDAKRLQESRQEGRQENRVLTARAMLSDNMDASLVARYTGLTADEVAELEKN